MQDPTVQLWCEDEVHFQRHSSLVRMWAPKGQQPRVLSPSVRHKVGFFGALNLKTGQLVTQEASTFRRFYPLFSPIYTGQNLFDSGQCQMAQVQRSQTLLRGQSASPGIYLSTSLLTQTQSNRASLEDHSSQGNPQPLFPFNRRPPISSRIPIYSLGFTQFVS